MSALYTPHKTETSHISKLNMPHAAYLSQVRTNYQSTISAGETKQLKHRHYHYHIVIQNPSLVPNKHISNAMSQAKSASSNNNNTN